MEDSSKQDNHDTEACEKQCVWKYFGKKTAALRSFQAKRKQFV